MKPKYVIYIIVTYLMISRVYSQRLPDNVCVIKKDNLVFNINLRWSNELFIELIDTYELDSTLIVELIEGKRSFIVNNEVWKAKNINDSLVTLYKQLERKSFLDNLLYKLIPENVDYNNSRPGYVNSQIKFGFNQFKELMVEQQLDGDVLFMLYGFLDAEQVYLAGSFNDWATNQTLMTKTEKGWYTTIPLEPYKYYYKYIVDGQWMHDPANRQTEPDGVGGENSVLYVCNHIFRLKDNLNAQNVFLSGTFNAWNQSNAPMKKSKSGWELPVYLSNGVHQYKFIVDGQWILDPENPNIKKNEFGTGNSEIKIGEPYTFRLSGFTNAQKVYIAGSFNNWKNNDIEMHKSDSGWIAPLYLSPGNYEYKFIIDEKWLPDPDNPITHGTGEFVNSFFVYQPNYTFVLDQFPEAQTVIVTGSFNGWIHHGYKMIRRNNQWEMDVFLPKGKHSYKFLVDGKWIHDPSNPNYEINKYNSKNSILWIK